MKKIILLIFLAFTILEAKEEIVQIAVGSEKFSIPTPENFIEISKLAPEFVDAYKTTLGYKANIRGYYFIKSDFEKLTKDENAKTKERKAVIYSPTAYENMNITEETFKKLIDTTLEKLNIQPNNNDFKQYNNTINTIQKKMTFDSGEAIKKVKATGVSTLGVSFQDKNSIGYTILLKYVDESKKSYIQVMDTGMSLINGKILVTIFYSAYENESDILWVQQESKKWVQNIFEQNKITFYNKTQHWVESLDNEEQEILIVLTLNFLNQYVNKDLLPKNTTSQGIDKLLKINLYGIMFSEILCTKSERLKNILIESKNNYITYLNGKLSSDDFKKKLYKHEEQILAIKASTSKYKVNSFIEKNITNIENAKNDMFLFSETSGSGIKPPSK